MPLRLTLLGGASGAGRTSWLTPNLRSGPFAGALAVAEGDPEALTHLRRLAHRPGLNKAVLELSPLADPARVRQEIAEDGELAGRVILGEALVVIDATRGAAEIVAQRAIRTQALGADAMVLTKLDACENEQLRVLIATLRLLNPKAALFGAVRGEEMELPGDGAVRPEIPPDLGAAALLPIDDWAAFSLWLSALLHARGADILRVRAWTRTASGVWLMHGVEGEMFAPEISHEPAPGPGEAVIVGRGFAPEDLAASLRAFVGD